MNMRIGSQVVDYRKVAEALNETNVAAEQILEMPSVLKSPVTSIRYLEFAVKFSMMKES